MIDEQGYRANVGLIIINQSGQVLWAKIKGKQSWQFPQGGIEGSEDPLESAYRELYEEVGLEKNDVDLIAQTRGWVRYLIPHKLQRNNAPVCIGQKQKWFLMRLKKPDDCICLDKHEMPEFDNWRWMDYWSPIGEIVYFKQDVYRMALCELASHVLKGDDQYLPKKYSSKK